MQSDRLSKRGLVVLAVLTAILVSMWLWGTFAPFQTSPTVIVVQVIKPDPDPDPEPQPEAPVQTACQPLSNFSDQTLGAVFILASVGRSFDHPDAVRLADNLVKQDPHTVLDEGIRLLQDSNVPLVEILETLRYAADTAAADGDESMEYLIDQHMALLISAALTQWETETTEVY